MKVIKITDTITRLKADDGRVLCKKGDRYYTEITDMCVPANTVNDYEEVPKRKITPYTKSEYKSKLVELIREKYDIDDEFNILHDIISSGSDEQMKKFVAYDDFVQECKIKAKEILSNKE